MRGREYILDVFPKIPDKLSRLAELADDLWYSWHLPTRALFGPLDPDLWDRVGHNPKLFLRRVDEHRLQAASEDQVFLASYNKVLSDFDTYLGETARLEAGGKLTDEDLVGYFCAEYGLHESLPIYSGGLGILAGDHCKGASDLRLPFVAIGLLYRAGYFSQEIDGEGNQIATYVESDVENLAVNLVRDDEGEPLTVQIEFPGRTVHAQVWSMRVGHVRGYLLDTEVEANSPEDRAITYQLYGGDKDTRIRQEVVLGVGGVRALRALGIEPSVWHINEGHSAFIILERARELVARGLTFDAALEAVAASTVFTTHTPVPAGHDHFPEDMTLHYLEPVFGSMGITGERLLGLGRLPGDGPDFNMTTLALKGSRHQNGVSRIHGAVSADICAKCWPQVPPEENPMGYITNGVHVPTFLSQAWADLFDRFLGADWRNHLSEYSYWQRIHEISDHLFWSVSQSNKSQMLMALSHTLKGQFVRNQMSEVHVERMLKYVDPSDPNVLTIGFARRFATYKRATLLLNDLDWLQELIADEERPVVFIFAGKAHPADVPGQQMIKTICDLACRPEYTGHVLLVEGYDIGLARRLLSGVDVWLNNPVYSMEASGTSGMKAAINGTINLSVTDGWWAEGFEGDNGWAIRPSPHTEDEHRRDAEDARTLYEILQDEVLPLYYSRGKYGYSSGWVQMVKRSMATVLPRFNMSRTVNEYVDQFYVPAARKSARLEGQDYTGAKELARWKERVHQAWPQVAVRRLDRPPRQITYGGSVFLEVAAQLDGLQPEDVVLEILLARNPEHHEAIVGGGFFSSEQGVVDKPADGARPDMVQAFAPEEQLPDTGEHVYRLALKPEWCGRLSYRVRMYPHHELLTHPLEMGLMVWL